MVARHPNASNGWRATAPACQLHVARHAVGMPGRGTPRHAIRIPDELWERFGEATQDAGTDRNAVIRALIRWYVKEQGAKLPPR